MNAKRIYVKRVLISLLIGLLFGAIVTEVPIFLLYKTARAPQVITLVIPKGTAEQIARGEQPPSIPQNMTFVVGDTLVVKNEDVVDHKLGTVWAPAGSSASLYLGEAANFAYDCSFQPDNYFGMDVRKPLTWLTHLGGIAGPGLSLGILLALYSLILPVEKKEHAPA
ncbi:MAG: hypothetical protein QY306_03255 [Anaerolineales bacterium]|nr:MAG: hypothetical protein QY306_03255 [Anaerolineales bacterium]